MNTFSSLRPGMKNKILQMTGFLSMLVNHAHSAVTSTNSAESGRLITPPGTPTRTRFGDHLHTPEKGMAYQSPGKQRRSSIRNPAVPGKRFGDVPTRTRAPPSTPDRPQRQLGSRHAQEESAAAVIQHGFRRKAWKSSSVFERFAQRELEELGQATSRMRQTPTQERCDDWTNTIVNSQVKHTKVIQGCLVGITDVLGEKENFRNVLYPILLDPRVRKRNKIPREALLYTSPRPGYSNGQVITTIDQYMMRLDNLGPKSPTVAFDFGEEHERTDDSQIEAVLEVRRFPIADFTVPDGLYFINLVSEIVSELQKGENVVIFCQAGEGRSGMILAGVLCFLGETDVINRIRKINQHYVEKWKQEKFIEMFENLLKRTKDVRRNLGHEVIGACLNSWSFIYTSEDPVEMINSPDLGKALEDSRAVLNAHLAKMPEIQKRIETIGQHGCDTYFTTCQNIAECITACNDLVSELKLDIDPDDSFEDEGMTREDLKKALFMRWCARNPQFDGSLHDEDDAENEARCHLKQLPWRALRRSFNKRMGWEDSASSELESDSESSRSSGSTDEGSSGTEFSGNEI